MAVGILIASLVVSTVLVPAVTTIIGEKAWWPRHHAPLGGPHATPMEDSLSDAA
jgi:RND superfamily putative drug exporter